MKTTKICVSVIGRNSEFIIKNAKKAKRAGAELIELRMDFLRNLDESKVEEITKKVEKVGLLTILTIRKKEFGGNFLGKESEQLALLLSGAEKVDFIDIELETKETLLREFVKKVKAIGKKVIISSHNFNETPELRGILDTLEKEKKFGADVCKFVSRANTIADNLRILSANQIFEHKKVLFCSGKLGKPSRILAPLFGSEWTFASLQKGKDTMEGQLDIRTTKNLIEKLTDERK
ncbi:MAG: type I 3-dehydroquinate dehydratase [Candidatus Altiarchaeota archaeon]